MGRNNKNTQKCSRDPQYAPKDLKDQPFYGLDLDPEQKNEYESIKEENQNYVLQIYQLREEMAELNSQLIEGENSLRNNPNKMEAHKLKDLINI